MQASKWVILASSVPNLDVETMCTDLGGAVGRIDACAPGASETFTVARHHRCEIKVFGSLFYEFKGCCSWLDMVSETYVSGPPKNPENH
jgi:hypothetical protein